MLNTCTKFQGQKIYQKENIQNLLTCVVVICEMFFITANFDILPKIEFSFFCYEIFGKKLFYIDNISSKFQGQKITTEEDINNLPTCIVLRMNCGNHFTTSTLTHSQGLKNFLFTMKFLSQIFFIIYMLITCVPNVEAKKVIQKKYSKSTNICSYENSFQYCQL